MKRQSDWPALLLFTAILLGGLVRFMPAVLTHFPLNDGGMFYTMTRELSSNGYALPATTAYNGFDLPYAYPPLGFYLASFLADFGRIPLIEVFLWLPPFLATLAIPAFYRLARALLTDNLRASLATLFFALTPGSYDWHIMGGGITRAAGKLFALLAAFYVLRLFQRSTFQSQETLESVHPDLRSAKSPDLALAILFCSLAVLSHPEVGLQTVGLCAVLWLFFGRTRRGALDAALVALGVILLSAPWWGTVILYHGLAPFLSAIQTGQHATAEWFPLLLGLFASSEFIPILLLLRVAGFAGAVLTRRWVFIFLVFMPAFIDPRSASFIAYMSMSMLAALGLLDALPALLKKWRGIEMPSVLTYRAGGIVLLLIAFTLFMECGLNNFRLVNTTLTADERAAMTWLWENMPPEQNFLILTGKPYSMSDPVQEWFPVFAGQHSQSTLQGLEWTLGAHFTNRLHELVALQACDDFSCVENCSNSTGLHYQYLWVTKTLSPLADNLRDFTELHIIYESESVIVFASIQK